MGIFRGFLRSWERFITYRTLLDISSPISVNYCILSADLGDFWGKSWGKGYPPNGILNYIRCRESDDCSESLSDRGSTVDI